MPTVDRESRKYQILGIHGADVRTVQGDVARVRMYVNGEQVDEDFPLPKLMVQVEAQLEPLILARVAKLETKESE